MTDIFLVVLFMGATRGVANIIDAKILIVEDEFIEAADLKKRLEKLGYKIVGIAATGEDAIQKTKDNDPDIVLMDIMLKGDMNGIEAAHTIGKLYDIPVIYLTAYFDNTTLEQAKKTAPYGYVLKPFEDMGLRSSIEMAVYNHHMEQRLKNSAKVLKFSNEMLKEINRP
jgi:two-component system, response regulator PdtaR